MNYWEIKYMDTANGPWLRVSLFVSGCAHACPWCFNEKLWDINAWGPLTQEVITSIIEMVNQPHIAGFSLLWGEPFNPAFVVDLAKIVKRIKKETNKPIRVWSWFTFDALKQWDSQRELLKLCDVLVDWYFVQELLDLNLMWRWSSNQRVLDIKKSLSEDKAIWLEWIHDTNKYKDWYVSAYEKVVLKYLDNLKTNSHSSKFIS